MMGWQWIEGDKDVAESTERENFTEILLRGRLVTALRKLNLRNQNPWLRRRTHSPDHRQTQESARSARFILQPSAGLLASSRRGLPYVQELDAIMENLLANDAQLLANWKSASHIQQPPKRRAGTEPAPPPVPPPDGGSGSGSTTTTTGN